MTECNANTIKPNHNVENHSCEQMVSEFHFGMMPAINFSVGHWSKLITNFPSLWKETSPRLKEGCLPGSPFMSFMACCPFLFFCLFHELVSYFPGPLYGFTYFYINYCSRVKGENPISSEIFFFVFSSFLVFITRKYTKYLKRKKITQKSPPTFP